MPRKKTTPEPLFSASDIKRMIESVAEIRSSMQHIQKMTEENQRTLRGHNGTEGLVTKIGRIEEQMQVANRAVENVKELSAKINRFSDYPTLTWLVRHRFKEVVGITVFMVSLFILIGAPVVDGEVTSRLNALILQFVGSLFGL